MSQEKANLKGQDLTQPDGPELGKEPVMAQEAVPPESNVPATNINTTDLNISQLTAMLSPLRSTRCQDEFTPKIRDGQQAARTIGRTLLLTKENCQTRLQSLWGSYEYGGWRKSWGGDYWGRTRGIFLPTKGPESPHHASGCNPCYPVNEVRQTELQTGQLLVKMIKEATPERFNFWVRLKISRHCPKSSMFWEADTSQDFYAHVTSARRATFYLFS